VEVVAVSQKGEIRREGLQSHGLPLEGAGMLQEIAAMVQREIP
jgi:hypothetical protein